MRRRFHLLLRIAALLLSAAAVAAMARSYWVQTWMWRGDNRGEIGLSISRGALLLYHNRRVQPDTGSPWTVYRCYSQHPPEELRTFSTQVFWYWADFEFSSDSDGYVVNRTLIVPSWAGFLLLGLLVTYAFTRYTWRRWRMRHRQRLGLCLRCGYDLRASPDRCPECGAPTSVSPANQKPQALVAGTSAADGETAP